MLCAQRCNVQIFIFNWNKCMKLILCLDSFFFFFIFQEFNYHGQPYKVCVFKADNGYISATAYNLTFFASSYVIPLILISGLYLRMCMRLWHTGILANNRSPDSHRGRKRVTRLVVVVVAAFATLWFPIQVIIIIPIDSSFFRCADAPEKETFMIRSTSKLYFPMKTFNQFFRFE